MGASQQKPQSGRNTNCLSVACVGDIAPIGPAETALLADTQKQKNHFESLFAGSDIVFGNLEAPLTSATAAREDKKYLLKANPLVLEAFPEKLVFSLANNHILDYGHKGLSETVDHLSGKGFRYTGAGKNLESAGKPVIIDCKGRKIGFLAAADTRHHAATKNTPGVFPATPDLLCPKIKRLRQETDIVYVSIHMGLEFIPVPAPAMIDITRQCRQAGAHVVFFHHAHCVSGYTVSPDGITLWGSGNFLFPEIMPYYFQPWFESAAWHIRHPATENDRGIKTAIRIEPLALARKNGLPQKADDRTGKKIIGRIDFLEEKINKGKNLGRLWLASMGKPAYIKLFMFNYADIMRRRGVKHLAEQIFSAIQALFLKRS